MRRWFRAASPPDANVAEDVVAGDEVVIDALEERVVSTRRLGRGAEEAGTTVALSKWRKTVSGALVFHPSPFQSYRARGRAFGVPGVVVLPAQIEVARCS
jgi:hypothetical protein